MQEKTTTATAPQAPKTTEEMLASIETLSDAKAVIKEQADRIGQLEARVAWLVRQWIGSKSEKQPAYDPNWPDLFQGQFADLLAKAQEESAEAEKHDSTGSVLLIIFLR